MSKIKAEQKQKKKPRKMTIRQVEKLLRQAAEWFWEQRKVVIWQKFEKRFAAELNQKESTK